MEVCVEYTPRKRGRITKTKEELLAMRNAGMTNVDIANVLGVSVSTVFNHIGSQGGKAGALSRRIKLDKKTSLEERQQERMVQRKLDLFDNENAKEMMENLKEELSLKDGHLAVKESVISLQGAYGKYDICSKSQEVAISFKDGYTLKISFDDLDTLAQEMISIIYNKDKINTNTEIW